MKIYTRRGDYGETDLYGGQRVSKSSLRVAAYGTVDELNACLGEVLGLDCEEVIAQMLSEIQADLFVLGADLATVGQKSYRGKEDVPRISDKRVTELESLIDGLDGFLKPMKAFIFPGGSVSGAKFHVARTVCRRAERLCVKLSQKCVKLSQKDFISLAALKYLNRLSDLLFVMARYENVKKGVAEKEWKP